MAARRDSLNEAQRRHLLTTCEYADKLLSDIEGILTAAASKTAFPKYVPDLTPAQAKMVQDYIARVRAQMIRVLDSQGIQRPDPKFGSLHSVRVTLGFVDIAFYECRAERMKGYGEVPESVAPELDGLVNELNGLVSRLDGYLSQGLGQDFRTRLDDLERAGREVGTIRSLERIITDRGLVEFRPALQNVLERLEGDHLEIAVFGRVSSGKSSLLNHIMEAEVLPVGVTPITAVPTRIVHGTEPGGTAWFADRKPERFGIERLPEFVTEQANPANARHVTRIVVEVPSARLRDGVVYVDTPGLGSLATSGAAETKAYLPRCDLGVVLVDAGATLSEEDIATVRALYEAGTPAYVLLSKADLLAPADLASMLAYVSAHLKAAFGADIAVEPVSVRPERAHLLDQWFERHILPLYSQQQELARRSVNRKIGALRIAVEAALRSKLKRAHPVTAAQKERLRQIETDLRKLTGRFADARASAIDRTDEIRQAASAALAWVAHKLIENGSESATLLFAQYAAELVRPISATYEALVEDSVQLFGHAAGALEVESAPELSEARQLILEMPRMELAQIDGDIRKPAIPWLAERRIEGKLRSAAGDRIAEAFSSYGRVLQSWVRQTSAALQNWFESYADAYRAQLDRLLSEGRESGDEEQIRRDLEEITDAAATV